jgi:HK97 family phage major capsid protein
MAFTVQTPTSAAAWRPDHYEFAPEDVLSQAAIIQTTTRAGEIEGDAPSVRVAFVDDASAENVDEAATLTEAAPALSEALIWTTKIAEHLRISREQYSQPSTPDQLSASAARSVVRKADKNLLTQAAPAGPDTAPAAGLLQWPGIVDGGPITENLDGLIDLIAELEINLATPSHLILGPLAWAEARKWKSALTYNSNLLGAGTSDAHPMMLSLPVLVNKAITDYSGLVVDSRAVISAYGTVIVATSKDRYFDSDSIGLNILWRTGHTVPRPNRLGKFTLPPQGS